MSNRDLADDLTLDILLRLRKRYPNDGEFGCKVGSFLSRVNPDGVELSMRAFARSKAKEVFQKDYEYTGSCRDLY